MTNNDPSTLAQAEDLRPQQVHLEYEQEYLAWHTRVNDTVGQPFDPTEFVQLAKEQWSDMPQLAIAFARCTAQWARREEGLYTHFIAPLHMDASWKFAGSRFLQHPTLGRLVVDVLHDETVPGGFSIGGIEYLDRVMRRSMEGPRELYWPAGDAVATSSAPAPMRIVHFDPQGFERSRGVSVPS